MTGITYIQLYFENISTAQSEILTALLSDIGFTGFEEVNDGLKTFIDKDNFSLPGLEAVLTITPAKYTLTEIATENWNAKWESSFEPIVVNDFVAIRAGFHQPIADVKHEIIITPKMSFGTGHHATTCLVIEQMEAMDLTGRDILDFGTGTGILAILAEKMGAAKVEAIDNDDWSIENAKENIAANHCTKISIEKAAAILPGATYDIILANINLNVIMSNMPAIGLACKTGAIILLSGFLHTDEPALLKELAAKGFTHLTTAQKGEWIVLQVKKA